MTDCEGTNRRGFLKAGFLGLGGLAFSDLLRIRAAGAPISSGLGGNPSGRAVIYLELAGGPTHIETYDPKPDAPSEYRGPFGTAPTVIPGVHYSELMTEQARIADKLAIIRSLHHRSGSHGTSSHLVQTGHYLRDNQNRNNEMPCIGSVVARTLGPNRDGMPPYVAIPRGMRYGGAAYLGQNFNPLETVRTPDRGNFQIPNIELARGVEMERLQDRRSLLSVFDQSRRIHDTAQVDLALDEFQHQAFDLITGPHARNAFDIEQEDPKTRDRYGRNATGQSCLLARRLVEAGVSLVSIRIGGWDDHNGIERRMKQKGPNYDRGVASLVDDLYARGLEQDVMVVAIGEFGRTPRVNRNAGRDHWGSAMSALMAGGGLKVGQVVGSTTSKGERPKDAPYRPENVLATVYQFLGIDPGMSYNDASGRPRHLLDIREPIAELIA